MKSTSSGSFCSSEKSCSGEDEHWASSKADDAHASKKQREQQLRGAKRSLNKLKVPVAVRALGLAWLGLQLFLDFKSFCSWRVFSRILSSDRLTARLAAGA